MNIGFVSLYLKSAGDRRTRRLRTAQSGKMGVVLLMLGGMHFFNLYVFTRMRRRATLANLPPPVPPMHRVSKAHDILDTL